MNHLWLPSKVIPPPPAASKQISLKNSILIVLIHVAFIATTAPAFWGKPNLEILLYRNGVYEELCTESDPPVCRGQRVAMSQDFTLGVLAVKFAGLLLGPVVDVMGPKFSGLLGLSLFAVSIILLCFSQVSLGFIFMGTSLLPVFNCTLSVANLFPRQRNFIISLMSSGGDAAMLMFLLLRLIHDRIPSVAVPTLLLAYLSVVGFQAVMVIVFFPFQRFTISQSYQFKAESSEALPLLPDANSDSLPSGLTTPSTPTRNYHEMPLKDQFRTMHFWVFAPMFCVLYFRKIFYTDSVGEFLTQIPGSTDFVVKKYLTIFSMIQGLGILWAWLLGMLADVVGFPFVLLVVNVCCLLSSLLGLVPFFHAQIAAFLCFSIFSSYTVGSAYAFVSGTFGFSHLGTLTGVLHILSGFAVMLNIPIRRYVTNLQSTNIAFTVVSTLLLFVPVYLHLYPVATPVIPPSVVERKRRSTILPQIAPARPCCLSAGPLFCELGKSVEVSHCRRCKEFACCCTSDMYCLRRKCCPYDNTNNVASTPHPRLSSLAV